jgi:hypothetical protein
VRWTPPAVSGALPVTGWTVAVGGQRRSVPAAARAAVFTGVPAGTVTVSVTACNGLGASLATGTRVRVAK